MHPFASITELKFEKHSKEYLETVGSHEYLYQATDYDAEELEKSP